MQNRPSVPSLPPSVSLPLTLPLPHSSGALSQAGLATGFDLSSEDRTVGARPVVGVTCWTSPMCWERRGRGFRSTRPFESQWDFCSQLPWVL